MTSLPPGCCLPLRVGLAPGAVCVGAVGETDCVSDDRRSVCCTVEAGASVATVLVGDASESEIVGVISQTPFGHPRFTTTDTGDFFQTPADGAHTEGRVELLDCSALDAQISFCGLRCSRAPEGGGRNSTEKAVAEVDTGTGE